jgi:hypothetical protein
MGWALLVHRFHDGAYDPGKDRAAASAANCVSDEATQRPTCSGIGTCSTPEQGAKKSAARDTAHRTAYDLGQLGHRHLLQDRADGLTAEDASNNLNDNRKKRFHI